MTDQELAQACAEALLERDAATHALGIHLQAVAPGQARLSMTVRRDMLQGHGTCHGGFIFALADSAFAVACNSRDRVSVALGCSIDYILPARLDDLLTAEAVEQSLGGRTGCYDIRIHNQHQQLIALFHGRSYSLKGSVRSQENQHE